jgi:6-phosphogluconolactonase
VELIITKDIDELSEQVAGWITVYIETILKKQNRFTFVLSGGSTPKKLYQLLVSGKYKNKIDWSKLHFFWGDERYVPFTDERNNAKMAFENLLDHVPVLKKQIYIMRTDIEPETAATEYEKLLQDYFPDSNHTFDLVLLGIGDNAHTLSLFPGYDIVNEKKNWVKAFYLEEQKMYRITLTAPVVNASRRIAFLVSGTGKAAALYHILSDKHDPDLYPSQIIQPYNDELYWWIDEAAAADIE